MGVNAIGIAAVVVFYVLILAVGLLVSYKFRKQKSSEDLMLAGRGIGYLIGSFTMTATWVGGAYINGTAEATFRSDYGLAWCQAPFGYALSLVIGGVVFAGRMREAGYVTMLDPLQNKYGQRMGGLLFVPALMGETFWSAAILAALGNSLVVIVNMDYTLAIVISTLFIIAYTLFGGLYSVAYTDVVQLLCIFIGLYLVFPFAMTHRAMEGRSIASPPESWYGTVDKTAAGLWLDSALLLVFGGIPWQVYFQRVHSSRTPKAARILSIAAAFGCLILATPPLLIGAVAKTADWNKTEFYAVLNRSIDYDKDSSMILPLVMQYMCPPAVTFIGLGAVSGAVMSSADSSFLSASCMFSRNIYQCIFRQKASEKEIIWVMRGSIIAVGLVAMSIGIAVNSVYQLWFLSSDLVYVILFPQLCCCMFINFTNTYGSLVSYVVGFVLRLLGGEPAFSIPPIIHYPAFDYETQTQVFPYKTFVMIIGFILNISISYLTKFLFERNYLSERFDILRCFTKKYQHEPVILQSISAKFDESFNGIYSKNIAEGQNNHF